MSLFYRPYNVNTRKWRYILTPIEFETTKLEDLKDLEFLSKKFSQDLDEIDFMEGDLYEEVSY